MFYDKADRLGCTTRCPVSLSCTTGTSRRRARSSAPCASPRPATATASTGATHPALLLDGDKLYVASSRTGALAKVGWNGDGTVSGTSTPVSGPAIDGVNWRARGAFVYAG